MQNNRLTTMNQWGTILYTGKYKKGTYRGFGDYIEDLNIDSIEQII